MSKNSVLREAKKAKADEFYTQMSDIENELIHYKNHFKDKVIFCNCDDPYESNFFKYFALNFNVFGLKKLIATCYCGSPIAGSQLSIFDCDEKEKNISNKKAYKVEINKVEDLTGNGTTDLNDIQLLIKNKNNVMSQLKGNGDFRSDECIELLKQADIVVTNPPFSLFREYVAQLVKYDKKFIIIGNQNAITYKETFPLIAKNKMWLGYGFKNGNAFFYIPNYDNRYTSGVYDFKTGLVKFRNCMWFTNLDISKRHEKLTLYKNYTQDEYPKYDNYNAINVDKTSDIPCDYYGVMGVPITFMDKYNPDQFEIVGITDRQNSSGFRTHKYTVEEYKNANDLNARACIKKDGIPKALYARILIRRK